MTGALFAIKKVVSLTDRMQHDKKKKKLIARFRSRPKDFTFDEAVTLLSYFGYQLSNKGKTSGSRVEFVEKTTGHVIGFHKPHPGNVLKPYVMDQISDQLESRGLI